ncbi:MAG: glycine-rich domain-containing protein [Pseudonocardiaceae bacterium]
MTSLITNRLSGRALVSKDLFERMVARIVADEQIERQLAERIMDQALAFLLACAGSQDKPLSPSKLIDIGWHTFILYTREYAAFCDEIAGYFIHHVPDDEKTASVEPAEQALARSVEAIQAAGLVVDTDLWSVADPAECRNCSNVGCGAGPPPSSSHISEV